LRIDGQGEHVATKRKVPGAIDPQQFPFFGIAAFARATDLACVDTQISTC
jgi:hypothetical protein